MPHVTSELREGIAIVRLDDGKANALSHALLGELHDALDRADKEATAVVLLGRPGKFSAGFDLQEMMAGPARAQALLTRGSETLLRLYELPQPLVIAASGHALAGGALTVLTGDVRVMARGAFRIGLNEVQIGMPLPILAMELARDRLNPSHLTAATLFANVVDPEQALLAGWVDELTDADKLLDVAFAHAKKLSALPREPYAKTKRALREKTIRYIRETFADDLKRLLPAGA